LEKYIAKQPDQSGHIDYDDVENQTWKTLYERQIQVVSNRACKEFVEGIELLGLKNDRLPQLNEVSATLRELTGWSVTPVPALITPDHFFQLLSNKQFPAATFIRRPEDLDYLEEPDIFHEFFGHCPMITHPTFADFLQAYGKKTLASKEENHVLLARLFWFTVEFGLIKTPEGPRCYGGGILSSKEETVYAVESDGPKRKPANLIDMLRTPYRVDQIQGIYFVIDSFDQLFGLIDQDLDKAIEEARALPELELIEINKSAIRDEWHTC